MCGARRERRTARRPVQRAQPFRRREEAQHARHILGAAVGARLDERLVCRVERGAAQLRQHLREVLRGLRLEVVRARAPLERGRHQLEAQ